MASILSLLAFGFGNLAMLGWLAAAAAPLLIHLWSRHRFRETSWAAMQFLLAAMRKNARRLQLQQWLLLLVRTAIIVLVVLAVAEPYGERLVAGGTSAATHKVVVIDGSYSMAYREGDGSNFARARQLAAELVRDSRPADSFTVILMDAPARRIVGRDVVERRAVAAQIEALPQAHAMADLGGALSLVHEAIAAEPVGRRAAERQEVYFFTDLQRSTWAALEKENHSAIDALAQYAALAVIDLGRPHAENLAIASLTVPTPFITAGRESTFEVTLRQFGQQPRSGCAVELLVDDVPVAEQTVDVPAGGEAVVRFTHRFMSPGEHVVKVRATGDNLSVDNSRWLVVPVREAIPVLCIAGRDGAARYVAHALNPNPTGNSPVRPVVVNEGDLPEVELSEFDAIFLCNVARMTDSEAERLRRFAAAGGGVVFFLGDQIVPDSYNTHAPSSRAERGNEEVVGGNEALALVPARIDAPVAEPQYGLDPLDYRHPIVAPFRGRERAGLLTTPVGRYYRLDLSESRPEVQVAAALPTGDPFIITAPLGRGRTVLVATDGSLSSVDPATGEPWTHWPTWPSFLPIVRELLDYATAGQQPTDELVGTPLAGRDMPGSAQPTNPSANTLEILRPDGRRVPVSVHSTAAGWEWSYDETDLSGVYALRDLPAGETQQFAVNVDPAGSNLAKIDPEQLPAGLVVRETWQQRNGTASQLQLARAAWSVPLLWAVLGLLFCESFLAWRFGRGVL